MKVTKSIDPPKFSPEQIAAAKKRMEKERLERIKQYATPAKGNITPSYPELTLISAGQALKAAKAVPTLLTKATDKLKTDLGKAARIFASDLIAGEAIDYADKNKEKPKTYERGGKMKMTKKMYMGGGMSPEYAKGGWIKKALEKHKPGALHKQMGVPMGEKIPVEKLKEAAKKGGKMGKRAQLAMTLRKFAKK